MRAILLTSVNVVVQVLMLTRIGTQFLSKLQVEPSLFDKKD